MTEDEFWNATPAETDRRQWAYRRRMQDAERVAVKQAYLTASWQRAKRLESLSVILARLDGPQELTAEEQATLQADHERLERELGER